MMHKKFYASGFLYHLPSQQILLQQDISSQNLLSQWFLFGKHHTEKEDPGIMFKNAVKEFLEITIPTVHPIYSYEKENTNHCIFYAEIDELQDFSATNNSIFNWFSFKNVLKLQIAEQTKHDIVVGQRVIEAASRKSRGEHTFQ
ncbi:MAG TPA: hypothetical protein VNW29_01045 [Candidatus Sulfotelmatobacter sp.]|jgi:hypothetical protein|nr:hypothetical protein [Candidatus Sulfotelmatobacter sp.]